MDLNTIDWKSLLIEYSLALVKFIIIIGVGLWIVSLLTKIFSKILRKRKMELALQGFLVSMFSVVLKILVFVSAIGTLGIEMTSVIAILGAAGLAVGLALSGTLQNFAGGVLLLLLKPFKVEDAISAQGHTGVVQDIQIFVTILLTPDNKTVLIPNGPLANGDIVNFSMKGIRRVDMNMSIGYGESIEETRTALLSVMDQNPLVLKDPIPFVGVMAHGASSIDLSVRCHCNHLDYWKVYFETMEKGKISLDKAGIEIPYPQQVNHLIREK
jgi:small conductance mechanosensitive channel